MPEEASSSAALRFEKVSKSFAGQRVLEELSLGFEWGERALLLGANGSGKSTLLRLACGLLKPDRGSVARAPARVAYLGHQSMLYARLTVKENLELMATLLGLPGDMREHLEEWDLQGVASKPVAELSRGQHFRAALCRVFLGQPKLILLDEPTSALDSASCGLLLAKLGEPGNRDTLAVMVSHDLSRVEGWASRVLLLAGGRPIADTAAAGDEAWESRRSRVLEAYHQHNR